MEKINKKIQKYEPLLIELLNEYKGDNVDYYVVIDKQNHHYQLLGSGWSNQNTYYCRIFIHFHLRQDGIICIFENHTEIELVDVLMEKGVPKSNILVSFLTLAARQYAGYAVA
jgi:XisI protein